MIAFEKITSALRPAMQAALLESGKGCEYSFTNMRIWGRQQAAYVHGFWVIFSQFDRKAVYPFPVGQGDVQPVLEAIIQDARTRGIPCCITGLNEENIAVLAKYYPGAFKVHCDRDGFDYVYQIDGNGNNVTFKGFDNSVKQKEALPYLGCSVHTKESWEEKQQSLAPDPSAPTEPGGTTGSGLLTP